MNRLFLFVSLLAAFPMTVFAQGTAFSFQGRLVDGGSLATGPYDMVFRLYAVPSDGAELSTASTQNDIAVTNGTFTVQLDFGNVFAGTAARFLQIEVRPGAGTGAYTVLTPRQEITGAPRAINAGAADALSAACDLCVTNAQIASVDGAKVVGPVTSSLTAAAVTGVVPIGNGGTGSATKNFVDVTTNQTIGGSKSFTGTVAVTGGGGVFSGNGSGLTNLNGANINGGSITSAQLSPEAVPNTTAFKLLGSLRWDLLRGQSDFPVSLGPSGLAFDGAHIWVANSATTGVVTKVRASDGATVGNFVAGSSPVGIAYDGANIWVTNSGAANVTKLRASDGANLGTFAVGVLPLGIAYDGANVWVANDNSNSVTKLRASDGANLGTFPVGNGPQSVAFDGVNIWVGNFNGTNTVTKLRASDGANLGSFPVGANPSAIAFDGTYIWVANYSSNSVTKLRASDGLSFGSVSVGTRPLGIAFDGSSIWVSNSLDNTVTKLRTSDGANLGTFAVGSGPIGLAFDGANIWVSNFNGNSVTRLLPAFPQ